MNKEEAKEYIKVFAENFAKEKFNIFVKTRFTWGSRVWGKCFPDEKRILFSENFIDANKDNIKVLEALAVHECCHLLEHGHTENFKNLIRKFGYAESHIRNEKNLTVIYPKPRKEYSYECPHCKKTHKSRVMYKTRRRACYDCCVKFNDGKFSDVFVFVLKECQGEKDEI